MKKYRLRDGTKVRDPRLDRLVKFDERSRNYRIAPLIHKLTPPHLRKKPRSYTWRCSEWLDQGNEGSCVGHGIGHELIARPVEVEWVNHRYCKEVIYWEAQKIDEWEGGSYPGAKPFYEGTSVLAGAKTAKMLGWIKSYRWGFSLEDLILGVGYSGPAVLGLTWLSFMMHTDNKGYIHADGEEMGGHCILCRGVNVRGRFFILRNSWGANWGVNGDCKITFADMEKLLAMEGESCFFEGRSPTSSWHFGNRP